MNAKTNELESSTCSAPIERLRNAVELLKSETASYNVGVQIEDALATLYAERDKLMEVEAALVQVEQEMGKRISYAAFSEFSDECKDAVKASLSAIESLRNQSKP